MRLRDKALLLFTAIVLVPVAGTVALLVDVNRVAVRASEEERQDAVLGEVADGPLRLVGDAEKDARAVAAVFGQGAAGALKDEDAETVVDALSATRDAVGAVRLEVPAAAYSKVIRRKSAAGDVPESTPELRKEADERGVAFGVPPGDPVRGVVVAR